MLQTEMASVQHQGSAGISEHPRKQLYTIGQTCQTLGIGPTSVYRLLTDGALQSVQIGRRRLIKAESIDRIVRDGA